MLIWAYKKIDELKGRTGFIDCPKELAEKLIADGHVQNPNVGGNHLKPVDTSSESSAAYEVKVMKPKVRAMAPKKPASEEGDK